MPVGPQPVTISCSAAGAAMVTGSAARAAMLPAAGAAMEHAGVLARATFLLTAFEQAVHYASVHSGVPAVVVASVALVAGYRLLRRTVRFAVQLTIAMTLVLVATYFGWLSF